MGNQMHRFLLTESDLKTFKNDGVVCLRGVLSEKDLLDLKDGVRAQMKGQLNNYTSYDLEQLSQQAFQGENIQAGDAERFDLELLEFVLKTDPDARPIRDKVEHEGRGKFFYDAAGWRFHEGIKRVALGSVLPNICTALLETKYTNFWEDTTFVKAPMTGQRTVFHQDWSYFQIEGDKCCIAWVPLDSVSEDNGRMEYIRGSHKWKRYYAPNVLIAQSVDPMSPYEKLPDIEANRDNYDIISFDVEPTDVIIHHVLTLHGAGGNKTKDKFRRAISFRYTGDDIRYFDKPGAVEQPHVENSLDNGERLISSDYPLVYGDIPLDC